MHTTLRAADAAALGAADWLSLAAAPTFALMALLTAAFGGKPDVLCAALQGTSPLSGMVPMYLLMSAFHLAPWLKLIFSRHPTEQTSGDHVADAMPGDAPARAWGGLRLRSAGRQ